MLQKFTGLDDVYVFLFRAFNCPKDQRNHRGLKNLWMKEGDFIAMELTLTEDDARTLRDFLRDHLPDLRFEVARTEVKSLRHTLLLRQELIERILALLDREMLG